MHQLKSTDGEPLENWDHDTADFVLGTTNLDPEVKQIVLTGWFSHEGIHLAPGVQNAMSNMQLVSEGKSKRINVMNRPLPKSLIDRVCVVRPLPISLIDRVCVVSLLIICSDKRWL